MFKMFLGFDSNFLSAYLPWGRRTVFLERLRLRVIGSITLWIRK